jgi:hypothetical protein
MPPDLTTGPRDLWWSYEVSTQVGAEDVGLLRFDGGRWRRVGTPHAITDIAAMSQDGIGGVWLLADANSGVRDASQCWYHFSSGRWTRQPMPSPRGYGATMLVIACIPGTRSALTVGDADRNIGTATIGIIASYGRQQHQGQRVFHRPSQRLARAHEHRLLDPRPPRAHSLETPAPGGQPPPRRHRSPSGRAHRRPRAWLASSPCRHR